MVQDTGSAHGLWVHQESAVILANSHDIWSFTPEFLLTKGVVPGDWDCTRATRSSDAMTIQYGPITWWMTENVLWITVYPDRSLVADSPISGNHVIPVAAKRYLEQVPHLPAQSLWFFWRLSAMKQNRHEWMLSNFLCREWPSDFGTPRLEPNLSFVADDILFQMTVKNEEVQRAGETFEDSIIFECFAYNTADQSSGRISLETDHWSARLSTVEKAIDHLLQDSIC